MEGAPSSFFPLPFFPHLPLSPAFLILYFARKPCFYLHTDQDWLYCYKYNSVHNLNRLAFSNSTRNLPGGHQALSASLLKWISSLLLVWGMRLTHSHLNSFVLDWAGCCIPSLKKLWLLILQHLKMDLCFAVTVKNLSKLTYHRNAYFVVMMLNSRVVLPDVSTAFLKHTCFFYVFQPWPFC